MYGSSVRCRCNSGARSLSYSSAQSWGNAVVEEDEDEDKDDEASVVYIAEGREAWNVKAEGGRRGGGKERWRNANKGPIGI